MKKSRTPTERLRFSKKMIELLESPKTGRRTVYDTGSQHLGLRIDANGTKSFFWFRKVRGTPQFKPIGGFPATSIEKARETVSEWDGQLAEWKRHMYEGQNPFEKPKDELTFEGLMEAYIARHIPVHTKRPAKAEKRLRQLVEFYLKDWRPLKLSMLERAEVVALHDKLGKKTPYAANRVVQTIRLLYNFAFTAELWKGVNPAARIKRFPEPERKRFLSPEELYRLVEAMKEEPSQDLRDFIVLDIFTGCRKASVFSAKWEDISFPDRRWMIPDPKKDPYAVPITVECEGILRERWTKRDKNSPWIFPSNDSISGHREDLKDRWRELLKRANIENLRIHDLRRTQGSWSTALGNPLFITGKGLGHASIASMKPYAQLDLEPIRQAMTVTNAALAVAMKTKPEGLPGT